VYDEFKEAFIVLEKLTSHHRKVKQNWNNLCLNCMTLEEVSEYYRKQSAGEKLPLTRIALQLNILCAHYQTMIWKGDKWPVPHLPHPKNYEWLLCVGVYSSGSPTDPPGPKAIIELV
jgi:hypothetical protein